MRAVIRLFILLMLLPLPAFASGMQDVQVERLAHVDAARRQARFNLVTRELAVAITSTPSHAVRALGLYEWEIATEHRLVFLNVAPQVGEDSSAWADLVESGDPNPVAYSPGVSIRKGLPWGFEVGARTHWLGVSRQMIVGGYGRVVPFGGWTKVPDISIQAGYTGLVGNDQLKLGVFDLHLSVGYTFTAPPAGDKTGTVFSPYGGYGLLVMDARPGAVDIDRVAPVTGFTDRAGPGVDPRDYQLHRIFGGMDVGSARARFRFSGEAVFPRGGTVVAGITMGIAAQF